MLRDVVTKHKRDSESWDTLSGNSSMNSENIFGRSNWSKEQVARWVSSLGLGNDYSELFVSEGIDGEALEILTANDIACMGVKTGDRLKLMNCLNDMRKEEALPVHLKVKSPSRHNSMTRGHTATTPMRRLKGGGQIVVQEADPCHHHMWGGLHTKAIIPFSVTNWVQWYKHLDALMEEVDLWTSFLEHNKETGDGTVDGLFFWGDFKVSAETAPTTEKKMVESSIDSLYDLTPTRLQQLFNRFDRDVDGLLMMHELGLALKQQGLTLEGQLKQIFRCVDLNQDGRIALPEFAVCLTFLKLAELHVLSKDTDMGHFSYTDFCAEEAMIIKTPPEPTKFFFGHRPSGFNRWIHVDKLSKMLLLHLSVKYHLHPLSVDDVFDMDSSMEQCTKVDKFGSHFYVTLTYFFLRSVKPRISYNTSKILLFVSGAPKWDTVISIVLGKQQTVEGSRDTGPMTLWQQLQQRIASGHTKVRDNKADFLMHELLASCFAELRPIIHAYRTRLQMFHELLVVEQTNFPAVHMTELSWISLELGELHRNTRPMKHVIRQLLADGSIGSDCKVYLQDVDETIEQAVYDLLQLRETCKALAQDYNRYNDVRLNDTLAFLTVASSIFMPAQFLSGIYGMNFEYMPELKWKYGYLLFWLVVVAYFAVGLHVSFKRFSSATRNPTTPVTNNTEQTEIPSPVARRGSRKISIVHLVSQRSNTSSSSRASDVDDKEIP